MSSTAILSKIEAIAERVAQPEGIEIVEIELKGGGMRFNEVKATWGGRMKYLKLIKLLYLAGREALSRWGRPISTDNYVSMDNGPVLSQILKRIDDRAAPGEPTFWTPGCRLT